MFLGFLEEISDDGGNLRSNRMYTLWRVPWKIWPEVGLPRCARCASGYPREAEEVADSEAVFVFPPVELVSVWTVDWGQVSFHHSPSVDPSLSN